MLNKIWPFFIIISFIFALLTGNINNFNNSIFDSCTQAVDLIIKLFGTMCLWNGLMKIVQKSSLINKLSNMISPLMKFLFPKMNKGDKEYEEITINIIANLLGIGNAATPLGIKAMQELQELNEEKDTASNAMCMFLAINTSSVTLVASSVVAYRLAAGSKNPAEIIGPTLVATIASTLAAVVAVKVFEKFSKNKKTKLVANKTLAASKED